MNTVRKAFELAARADRLGVALTRLGLIVVLLWIGGLKAFPYEADGIVPFVANSPLMSFFYADPGNYQPHMNPEGKLIQKTGLGTKPTAPMGSPGDSAR
jgi:uncharacterized membrane protein YkgB